jgi:esterase/lipase superfamily enzyme
MTSAHIHWYSTNLRRRMDLLWIGTRGRPVLWFPTFRGRYLDAEGFGLTGAVADSVRAGRMQIACVDSVDAESFGATHLPPADRLARQEQYDRYLADELVPWIHDRTGKTGKLATMGASFGAYHAVNFGFRHPDLVGKVVGLSGAYDIHDHLDGYWDDTAYFHCPPSYVGNMGPEWRDRIAGIDISIVSGEDDYLVDRTRAFTAVLDAKEIPHRGDVWAAPASHDWKWWQQQARHYLP